MRHIMKYRNRMNSDIRVIFRRVPWLRIRMNLRGPCANIQPIANWRQHLTDFVCYVNIQINVEVRLKQTAGLGAYVGSHRSLDDVNAVDSSARWIKAQDRYAKLSSNQPPGEDPSDSIEGSSVRTVARTAKDPIKWVKKSTVSWMIVIASCESNFTSDCVLCVP
jgi:hypothetical protein